MNLMNKVKWYGDNGELVSCHEKIKVMEQNIQEITELMQYLLEDGVLMGISETQIKLVLQKIVSQLKNPYTKNNKE